ncbi:hypothetical protein [Oceanicoccus sp. KOV_DT_Chl]|uniref:hypothetical protein n=1 Tax=Oceanicoccus sp. KOV_DT_Chl TaxID=1904639 RepID=UPI000C7DE662|nr:hypothetical protein [Oceanicoccus sp. KOV_DT_Chl]
MNRNTSDWKDKYLDALDEQEKRDRQFKQMMTLLTKGIIRISMVAEGIDGQLDKQLAGMRQMFRDGSPSRRDLNTVIDALEGQVKRIDTVKTERAKVIASAFQSLVSQLQSLKPEKEAAQQLNQLGKVIKIRSGKIQEYSALINDYVSVQQEVLNERNIKRVSKPFWHQWSAEKNLADEKEPVVKNGKKISDKDENNKAIQVVEKKSSKETSAEKINDGLDLADQVVAPRAEINADAMGEEPAFSRLNQAICEVLDELLQQIEAPPMAKENYQAAKRQIEKGLNWYELVPTLEDISIVVVSAFHNNQKDFETFLNQLNDRLSQAFEFISASGNYRGRDLMPAAS